MMIILGSLECA